MNEIKNNARIIAGKVANRVIEQLRAKGLDCVRKGSRDDASSAIHDAVFATTIDVIEAKRGLD